LGWSLPLVVDDTSCRTFLARFPNYFPEFEGKCYIKKCRMF